MAQVEYVKIRDKKSGAIMTVKKCLASDYIGTGRFELAKDEVKPSINITKKVNVFNEEK